MERFQLKEVLKILLHSIIFQRALGECRLRDVDSELFDISCAASPASAEMAALADFRSRGARYVRCDSRLVEARVEEHAEAFSSAIERGARVSLAFFERRARQAAFGLFRSEARPGPAPRDTFAQPPSRLRRRSASSGSVGPSRWSSCQTLRSCTGTWAARRCCRARTAPAARPRQTARTRRAGGDRRRSRRRHSPRPPR